MGHALSARRRNYEVDGVSLTIIGGHTTVQTNYRRARDQALIAFAGPVATLLVGICAWAATTVTSGVAHSIASWLAWSSFIIGAVNLLPGVPLDGGAILDAVVWRLSRNRTRGRQVSALSGLVVAALWASSPWIVGAMFEREVQTSDVIISGVVGLWMASTAWRAFVWAGRADVVVEQNSGVEETVVHAEVPNTQREIRSLVRRATAVDTNMSLEDSLKYAADHSAGAILVTAGGRVVGIVRDSAVAQALEEGRTAVPVASVARRIESTDHVLVSSTLADIAEQLANAAAAEWLVVDREDAIVGVLFRSDLQRSLNV